MFSRKPPQPSLSKNVQLQTVLFAAVKGGHESTVALLLAKDPALIHVEQGKSLAMCQEGEHCKAALGSQA